MSSETYPTPPASIARYVKVLGVDGTIAFLLEFGGSEFWFPTGPESRSELVEVLGAEKALAICEHSENLKGRVPVAKPWLAAVLKAKGLSNARIARRLHVTDETVRAYLSKGKPGKTSPDQLKLF